MKNTRLILILFTVGWLSSCASLKTASTKGDEVYREDLSIHRDPYPIPEDTVGSDRIALMDYENVVPVNDVTAALNEVLDAGDELKSELEYVDGYTIQIYTGNSSEDARKLRGKAISLIGEEDDVELFYDEPNFKVKVGEYYSRLEAQDDYGKLQKQFPMAIIIPAKIPVP